MKHLFWVLPGIAAVVWLLFGFVMWEINPALWSQDARFFAAWFIATGAGLCVIGMRHP